MFFDKLKLLGKWKTRNPEYKNVKACPKNVNQISEISHENAKTPVKSDKFQKELKIFRNPILPEKRPQKQRKTHTKN